MIHGGGTVASTAINNITVTCQDGVRPTAIVLDPSGRYAYVANFGSNTVSQYQISTTDGSLSCMTPATAPTGNAPCGIALR